MHVTKLKFAPYSLENQETKRRMRSSIKKNLFFCYCCHFQIYLKRARHVYTNLDHQFSKLMDDFSILCQTLEDETDLKILFFFFDQGIEKYWS